MKVPKVIIVRVNKTILMMKKVEMMSLARCPTKTEIAKYLFKSKRKENPGCGLCSIAGQKKIRNKKIATKRM